LEKWYLSHRHWRKDGAFVLKPKFFVLKTKRGTGVGLFYVTRAQQRWPVLTLLLTQLSMT